MRTPIFTGDVHVIGAGGVGSWLIPALCKLIEPAQVKVYDGDKLEVKNMDRQLFQARHIGHNKAEALGQLYGCGWCDKYYSIALVRPEENDFIICCADNDPARLSCISAADLSGCRVIVAANEKYSAEAYYYEDKFVESAVDPRVYYPQLLTNHADDPRAAAIGCTGEAQLQSPQLVSANFMAASLAGWLFVLWGTVAPGLTPETRTRLPYHMISNMSRLETKVIGDQLRKDSENELSRNNSSSD